MGILNFLLPQTGGKRKCLNEDIRLKIWDGEGQAPDEPTICLVQAFESKQNRRDITYSAEFLHKRLEDAQRAIDDGAKIDFIFNGKYPTIFYTAVLYGDDDLDMVRLLAEAGATNDITSLEVPPGRNLYQVSDTVLGQALSQHQYKAARLLVEEFGVDPNGDGEVLQLLWDLRDDNYPINLSYAYERERCALLRCMIMHCTDDALSSLDLTPFQEAEDVYNTEAWCQETFPRTDGYKPIMEIVREVFAEKERKAILEGMGPITQENSPKQRRAM